MGSIQEHEQAGQVTPAVQYLRTYGPKQALDKWGQPLPLSAVDQDRLDRLFAILVSPSERGRALLVAGMLIPDEVTAIRMVYPEIYSSMVNQALHEMLAAKPPFPAWVESSLGVLFGQPAAQVFGDGAVKPVNEGREARSGGDSTAATGEGGTPADRREIAVREQRS